MTTLRQVNLELGMPTVEQALGRLTMELQTTRRLRVRVLKVIHGYGSSGKGGKIRTALRRQLQAMAQRGEIRGVIPGESFSIFDETTRQAFALCGELRQDRDLDRYNNGVTFILL